MTGGKFASLSQDHISREAMQTRRFKAFVPCLDPADLPSIPSGSAQIELFQCDSRHLLTKQLCAMQISLPVHNCVAFGIA